MNDPIEACRAALAGASAAREADVAAIYLAVARVRIEVAKKEIASLETLLAGREREAARVLGEQLTLGDRR
jgi:hypothetical protein